MNDRKGLNEETSNSPQARADAETARSSTIETHGDVTYQAAQLDDDGLISYKPQADASACVYCKKTDVPLSETEHTKRMACDACTQLVDASMQKRIDARPQPEKQLPESWERDAQKAASRAAMAVRSQYECTMKALSKDSKDRPRAYWLDSFPCPSWCAYPETHRNGDQPGERIHDGDPLSVTFDTEEPSTGYAEYKAPEMKLFLMQGYREAEPRVHVEKEGEPVAWATLAEAEQLAFHLLDLVRQARGQEGEPGPPVPVNAAAST